MNTPKIKLVCVIVFLNLGMTLHSGMNATVLFAGKEVVRFAVVTAGF